MKTLWPNLNAMIDLGEITVSFADQGSRQADEILLFVHGFPLDHSMWRGQLNDLADDFRCVAPDLRGFGGTSVVAGTVTMEQLAGDLDRLLQELRIDDPVTLCGLSMGGYVAWEMWRRNADRLRRLILCDTRAQADSVEVARGRQLMAQQVERDGMQGVSDTMIPKLFAADSLEQQADVVNSTRSLIDRMDPQGVAAAQRGMAERRDFSNRLNEMELPILAVCGRQDAITTCAEMRSMAERLPNGHFVEIDSAGHLAPLEQPAAVNAAIRKFVKTT